MKKFISVILTLTIITSLTIPAFAVAETDEVSKLDYDPSSILITLEADATLEKVAEHMNFNQKYGEYIGSIERKTPIIISDKNSKDYGKTNEFYKIKLAQKGENKLEELISAFKKNPNIKYVDKNYYGELFLDAGIQPNDTRFSEQYALTLTGAHKAWAIHKGSSNVLVGVIDSGIRSTHEDLTGKISSTLSRNFAPVSITLDDLVGHGTHVSGIISAATNNNKGVAGTLWYSNLVNLKITDTGALITTDGACEAINYAQSNGIKILNCSFGFSRSTSTLQNAVANYTGLIIAAAGNNGNTQMMYPAGYNYSNIISVAASTATDTLWTNSNRSSTWVDLAAPGVNILSTYRTNNTSYTTMSGTSMAAPLVTGTAALILSIKPNISMSTLKNYILNNVDPVSSLSNQVLTGGRLNTFMAAMAATNYYIGDVDNDGKITAADARLVLRYSSLLETPTALQGVLADVDFDGKITASDSRLIQRDVAMLEEIRQPVR